MDDELTNRRGLMRGIARQVARRAREAATAHAQIGDRLAPLGRPTPLVHADSNVGQLGTFLPAQLTERCVACEELLTLADDHRLALRVTPCAAIAA